MKRTLVRVQISFQFSQTVYYDFLWLCKHDDVIKWKHFPRYWPFVRGIHRSPVNSPHKGQWRGALMFSLICVWINGWVNNREAGDLRRYRAHYDVIVMTLMRLEYITISPTQLNEIVIWSPAFDHQWPWLVWILLIIIRMTTTIIWVMIISNKINKTTTRS